MYPTARQDKLLVQELGDELVVYDQESDRAHRLNRTAALVWRHCDGRTGVAALAEVLRSELDLPPDDQVVQLALDRLERANLLRLPDAPAESTPRRPVSRRHVMRRLAAAGAASMLLPVVSSITAPTPAQAHSREPRGR